MTSQKQREQIAEFLKEIGGAVDVFFQQNGAVGCRFSSKGGWYFIGWEEKLIKQVEACKTEKDKT